MHLPKPLPEPGKWISAVQAAAAFALTMFALLWGISFNFSAATPPPQFDTLIVSDGASVPLPPPPKVEKSEPETETAQETPPSETASASAPDADIVLKKKEEEEEKEKRRKEEERKKREQQKRDEVKKKKEEAERKQREEEAQKRREAEAQQRREEEAERRQEEEAQKQQEEEERQQREAEAREREEAQRIAREIEIDNERQAITGRIRRRIEIAHNHPASVPVDADIEVVIVFRLITKDECRAELREKPKIIKSSGNAEYDDSVWRAIIKSGIFPFPCSPELAGEFLDNTLRMSPLDK